MGIPYRVFTDVLGSAFSRWINTRDNGEKGELDCSTNLSFSQRSPSGSSHPSWEGKIQPGWNSGVRRWELGDRLIWLG